MKRAAIFALAIAACSPSAEEPPLPNEEDRADAAEELPALPIGARAPVSIEGEWRLAGINGVAIDMAETPTASIGTETIDIASGCLNFSRSYVLDGVNLSSVPVVPAEPGTVPEPPPPVCARGWLPEERPLSDALREADTAYRLPDQSLVLDGPGGSLTLFTQ